MLVNSHILSNYKQRKKECMYIHQAESVLSHARGRCVLMYFIGALVPDRKLCEWIKRR